MEPDDIPPQLRGLLRALERAVSAREPALRGRVEALRAANPYLTNHQLAHALVRSTRRRVATTGALSGAVAIAPGLGTLLAIGTLTSQTLYALEQEVELVLGIAIIFGHELAGSDDRVLEALLVVGAASGVLKLREDVVVAGGERLVARMLARVATTRARRFAARIVPLGLGVAVGATFDWVTVSGLGAAAIRYYGPGGPGAKQLLVAREDASHVEPGR